MIELTGITWNHTRGYVPLVATAQRFSELHPGIAIRWDQRSLQQFADAPIEQLAESYDLLVIDHPFVGYAAAHDVLLALDGRLSKSYLEDQAASAVGASHASYSYGGHQWGLAIDTAAPICGYRPDLLAEAGAGSPQTWPQLLELARRGLVAIPAVPVDSLMHFYMLCGALGEEPFQTGDAVVTTAVGSRALSMLRELLCACGRDCLGRNPIATWDLLAAGGSTALCPFAYGYSNYARPGYARNVLQFGGLIAIDGRTCRSTLGGAGLAISSRRSFAGEALRYAEYVASAQCQATLYFDSGGQPGHRAAWLDPEVNRRAGNFFRNTLETLDHAYLRPRYDGYLQFQDTAGPVVYGYLRDGGEPARALDRLNQIYLHSRGLGGAP